ncbi:MAG: T9SS type A sorting domain-containing protein, partial [Candidatus Kapabacteria bacterium]|nr:T9SS type A sorting domain-containing protein [Candidatus Kapabacteria bacterium]
YRNRDVVLSAGFGEIGVVRYGDGRRARLWWETVGEEQVSHFVVERRAVGQTDYGVIGVVGAGGGNGQQYRYDDEVERVVSYEYRVGMVSRDGSVRWSRSVVLAGEEEGWTVGVWPQPAESEVVVEVQGGSGESEVEVVDVVGRVMPVAVQASGAGVYRLDVRLLPAGVYTVVVRRGEMVVRQTITVVR